MNHYVAIIPIPDYYKINGKHYQKDGSYFIKYNDEKIFEMNVFIETEDSLNLSKVKKLIESKFTFAKSMVKKDSSYMTEFQTLQNCLKSIDKAEDKDLLLYPGLVQTNTFTQIDLEVGKTVKYPLTLKKIYFDKV